MGSSRPAVVLARIELPVWGRRHAAHWRYQREERAGPGLPGPATFIRAGGRGMAGPESQWGTT
jgi:hypothetical protein